MRVQAQDHIPFDRISKMVGQNAQRARTLLQNLLKGN